jgi:hypothetical protein
MAMVTEVKRTAAMNTMYPVAKQVHTYTFNSLPLQLGDQLSPVTLLAVLRQELAAFRQQPTLTAPASEVSAPVDSRYEPLHSKVKAGR